MIGFRAVRFGAVRWGSIRWRSIRWRSVLLVMTALSFAACRDSQPPQEAPSRFDEGSHADLLRYVKEDRRPLVLAEIDALIEAALAKAPENASEKEKALHLVWYIHTHFYSVDPTESTLLASIRQRKAQCGFSSLILQHALRRLGFQTRGAGFFAVPLQGGHTSIEAKWDGRWHYLDPSFGAFATSDGTLNGDVLSLDTILRYRDQVADNFFYALSEGRLGPEYPEVKGGRLDELFSRRQSAMLASGNYRLFLREAAGGTPYSESHGLETTYRVDLGGAGRFALGAPNDSVSDIMLHTVPGKDRHYDATALYFVGRDFSSHGPLYGTHTFEISGLKPGDLVTWEATLVRGTPAEIAIAPRKAELLETKAEGDVLTAIVRANAPRIELAIGTHGRNDRVYFDAHRFQRLGSGAAE